MGSTDWDAWHADYADPDSALSERLEVVRRLIRDWLDRTAPSPVTVLSSCAGDGRDLLGVLEHRPDASRVRATLLDADPRNTARAERRAGSLPGVEVRCTDASSSSVYAGLVPADLVLLCGIFGNLSDQDVRRLIGTAPQFCRPGALLVWTRHRNAPDLTPRIREWFAEHDFAEEEFVAPDHAPYAVGAHRFTGEPQDLEPDRRLFTFLR